VTRTQWSEPSRAAFLALTGLAFGVELWLGRGLTFFADEWAFIRDRSLGDPSTWLAPHNEHWATVPVLAYRALVETVGLRTYVPYLALLLTIHVIVAWLVFGLVRRRTGSLGGLAAGTLVLFLGSGFENLYWAFQIGFVGAMAAGLAAVSLLTPNLSLRRTLAISVLLLIAVATQGIGLLFLVVVAVELGLQGRVREAIAAQLLPAIAYIAWFVFVGHEGVGVYRNPFLVDSVLQVPEFVLRGFGDAFGAITGIGPTIGIGVAGAVLLVAGTMAARGQPPPPRFWAVCAAIAAEYVLIGLTRAGLTPGQVEYTRYTYVSSTLALIALGELVGLHVPSLRTLPTFRRRVVLDASAAVFALAMIYNVWLLIAGRDLFLKHAEITRALVYVAIKPGLATGEALDRSLVLVPSPADLRVIVGAYGSPLSDDLVPWAVEPISPAARTEALRRLRDGAATPG
jgi:hypothetical protein